MIRLYTFINKMGEKYSNLKESLAAFLSHTVSKINSPQHLTKKPQATKAPETTLNRRQTRQSGSAILIGSSRGYNRSKEAIKSEALLDIDVPQHQISDDFIESSAYPGSENFESLKTLVRNPKYSGPVADKAVTDPIVHLSVMEPDTDAHNTFMSSWRKLVGSTQEQEALSQLDGFSQELKEFINSPDSTEPPALARLNQTSEMLKTYRDSFNILTTPQQKSLEYFFDAIEQQIKACWQQIDQQRKASTRDFLIHGTEFQRACDCFNINPRRDISMAQLQSLQQQLEGITRDYNLETLPKLRRRCMTLMNQFLQNPGKPRAIRKYNLPPMVPPHSGIPPRKTDIENRFIFEGDNVNYFSTQSFGVSFHGDLVKHIASQWTPGNKLPKIPNIVVKSIDKHTPPTQLPTFMVITAHPDEQDQKNIKNILLTTSLCKFTDFPTPGEGFNYFEREAEQAWGLLCSHYANQLPKDNLSFQDCSRWMSLIRKINVSLEELGSKQPTSREEQHNSKVAIQRLYFHRAMLEQLIDLTYTNPAF